MFNKFKRKRPTFHTPPTMPRKKLFAKPKISRMQVTIGLLIIFALLIIYSIFFSKLFSLKLVEFENKDLTCVDKTQVAKALPKDENLLFINIEQITDLIKSKYACLEYVELRKKFPDTVVISATERKIVAVLVSGVRKPEVKVEVEVQEASPSSGSAALKRAIPPVDDFKINEGDYSKTLGVDIDGYALVENPEPQEGIPVFYYLSDHSVELNQMVPEGIVQNALTISSKLYELGIQVNSQKIIDTSLYIDGPQRIIFLLEKDPLAQVIPLQLILQKAKIDSTPIEKIDLRFDKPVVVYGKKTTR